MADARLRIEPAEERIAPSTVGELHDNPDNPDDNHPHDAAPDGAVPERPAGAQRPPLRGRGADAVFGVYEDDPAPCP
jgi:hypothetical protein